MNVTRRSFVGSMGAGVAALGALAAAPGAEAQLVYMPADWHAAEFDKLVKIKARVRQVFDAESLKDGGPMGSIRNSINGLQFGYNIPPAEIRVVGAFRGQANLMNFDDSMWAKYKLGEYLKIDDPKTQAPATRNIFWPKNGATVTEVNDPKSIYQDSSIEALTARGLTLLSCHNATTHQAAGLIKRFSLTASTEEVVKDLQTHMLPGCISVPAMVSAIAVLQCAGQYAYTTG